MNSKSRLLVAGGVLGSLGCLFHISYWREGRDTKPLPSTPKIRAVRYTVRVSPVTEFSNGQSVRNPNFVLSNGATPSLHLLWRTGVQDKYKPQPGQVVVEPRRTCWSVMKSALWSNSKFQISKSPLDFNYAQWIEGDDNGADFFVLNPYSPDESGREAKQLLLFHPLVRGGGISATYRLVTRPMSLGVSPSQTPRIEDSIDSELPRNGHDPEFLHTITAAKQQSTRSVQGTGGRVIGERNLEQVKKAKIGDVFLDIDNLRPRLDYYRVRGAQAANGDIYLTGIDRWPSRRPPYKQDDLWVTHSKDGAKTWDACTFIGHGRNPTIAGAANGDVLVFSTRLQSARYGFDMHRFLAVQRSHDGGKTWSKATRVFNAENVVQNRVYRAPDGRLWLVYVQEQGDTEPGASLPPSSHIVLTTGVSVWKPGSSLWLSSSTDDGATWRKPRRLTDGKNLDHDPDLVWHDGKLLIAFARVQETQTLIKNNIWTGKKSAIHLAEIENGDSA